MGPARRPWVKGPRAARSLEPCADALLAGCSCPLPCRGTEGHDCSVGSLRSTSCPAPRSTFASARGACPTPLLRNVRDVENLIKVPILTLAERASLGDLAPQRQTSSQIFGVHVQIQKFVVLDARTLAARCPVKAIVRVAASLRPSLLEDMANNDPQNPTLSRQASAAVVFMPSGSAKCRAEC